MLAQISVHFILIFISTPIPLIFGDCITDADDCFNKFRSDLENQMRQPFDSNEIQLKQICDPNDGSFNKFVKCVDEVKVECHSDKKFRANLCEKRYLKTRITKFQWKATFFYQLCHNTNPELRDFFEDEDCINSVYNSAKWKCDSYERIVKSKKDWKTDHYTTCSLWQKFRDCSKRDIVSKCRSEAGLISDNLFHSHQSYFEKYYTCYNSSKLNEQCWYDSIKATQTSLSMTTQPTNDMRHNNISPNSHTLDDNTSHSSIQSSDTILEAQTPQDTTESQEDQRESSDDWQKTEQNTSISVDLKNKESDDMIATESYQTHEVIAMKVSNNNNTQNLNSYSVALTDSLTNRYSLITPIIITFIINLII